MSEPPVEQTGESPAAGPGRSEPAPEALRDDRGARPVHLRTIRVEAFRVGDDALDVTGRLVDERPDGQATWFDVPQGPTIHDMSLTIRVRFPALVITAVSGTMTEHPYTICPGAVPALDQLVGLSVARGFTRAVNERLGRDQGCAHLTALLHAIAPVVKQAGGVAFGQEQKMPSRDADLWFVGGCHAWREDGPLARGVRAGDRIALRDLRARRPS